MLIASPRWLYLGGPIFYRRRLCLEKRDGKNLHFELQVINKLLDSARRRASTVWHCAYDQFESMSQYRWYSLWTGANSTVTFGMIEIEHLPLTCACTLIKCMFEVVWIIGWHRSCWNRPAYGAHDTQCICYGGGRSGDQFSAIGSKVGELSNRVGNVSYARPRSTSSTHTIFCFLAAVCDAYTSRSQRRTYDKCLGTSWLLALHRPTWVAKIPSCSFSLFGMSLYSNTVCQRHLYVTPQHTMIHRDSKRTELIIHLLYLTWRCLVDWGYVQLTARVCEASESWSSALNRPALHS